MTSIETAAAYATSPERLAPNQWKATPSQAPLSTHANLVLQTLRETGQYMGVYAIIQRIGSGTPGETERAITELEERGLLEPTPGEGQEQPQEPAQEPSSAAPAPAPRGEQPTPHRTGDELLAEITAAQDAAAAPATDYPDVPHDLKLGVGPVFGTYPTLSAAVARAEEYILSKEHPWEYVARVRAAAQGDAAPGPWIRVRDPRAPKVEGLRSR